MTNLSYITVLSNWILGYDKYSGTYSKSLLNKSTYPNEFYLLQESDLHIGVAKANALMEKLGIPKDKLIRIDTEVSDAVPNTRNGKGLVIPRNYIKVTAVFELVDNKWVQRVPEHITAMAYQLQINNLKSFENLSPRTFSFLPIAIACDSKCKFCFSGASISDATEQNTVNLDTLEAFCSAAASRGAQRFVITGGGEPGLLPFESLISTIQCAKKYFNSIILITNGHFLHRKLIAGQLRPAINSLQAAGLTVLSISRHSHLDDVNNEIMGSTVSITSLLNEIHLLNTPLRVRLVCVLQKSGVSSAEDVRDYVEFARNHHVKEVCFKELYVASTLESEFAGSPENLYSIQNQVPLSVVTDYYKNSEVLSRLPWGCPIFNDVQGAPVAVAAYTEPSVGWERLHGIARSWNLLSSGKCYASLEDFSSEITL